MSQITVYKCDQCKKEIGLKPHISLLLRLDTSATGIACPPDTSTVFWRTTRLDDHFLHFHDGKCIGAYFDALIKKATAKVATKK